MSERVPHFGQPAQQFERLRLRHLLAVRVRAFFAQLVPQRAGDLRGQFVVQRVDQVADVVADVPDVQVLALAVPGEQDFVQIVHDPRDRVAVGQRFVREVVEPAALGVGLDEPVGDRGEFFLQTNVRSHREPLR